MKYSLETFEKGLEELNISLTERQKEQFIIYYEMLVEKNKVMNLTAITDFDEVIEKHFLDSLALSQVQNLNYRTNVLVKMTNTNKCSSQIAQIDRTDVCQ